MSRIDANQLPTPEAPQPWAPQPWGPHAGAGHPAYPPAQPAYAPLATAPRPPATRNLALVVAGGVVALAIGAFALLNRDDHSAVAAPGSTASTPANGNGTDGTGTDGTAGNAAVTIEEIDNAYSQVFGLRAASTTLDCISSQIGAEGGQAARLANGDVLNFEETVSAFVVFVGCAPDDDFLARLVPATVQVLGGSADEACIADSLVMFRVGERAEALAEVWMVADEGLFAETLYNYFLPCAV
ncbi:MAG: hypothetical protein Q7V88_07440 [Actinomycetota bacterium]|nr:hypothetical protein [Actinomycetota bacterium]